MGKGAQNRIIYGNPSVEVLSKYLYPLVPNLFAFASKYWIKEILYGFLNTDIPGFNVYFSCFIQKMIDDQSDLNLEW